MAIGKVHHVLCPVCRVPAHTTAVYPNNVCGAEGSSHDIMHLMCTEPPGTNACTHGLHTDGEMHVKFKAAPDLRARRSGETRRA
jgi:hypothetical protein